MDLLKTGCGVAGVLQRENNNQKSNNDGYKSKQPPVELPVTVSSFHHHSQIGNILFFGFQTNSIFLIQKQT